MKKIYYSWSQVEGACLDIARQMSAHDWKPDYIVGITRGGLVPANLLSQYMGIKMHTLNVSLRDSDGGESNLWMAEDAFGYDNQPAIGANEVNSALAKNILIVDDINDSGATLNWIRQDWPSGCLPNHERWDQVWGNNVRVAVLIDNESSQCELPIAYKGRTINKQKDPCWVVYPWEEWWLK